VRFYFYHLLFVSFFFFALYPAAVAVNKSPEGKGDQQVPSDSLKANQYLEQIKAYLKSDYDSAIIAAAKAQDFAKGHGKSDLLSRVLILKGNAWYFKGVHDSSLALYLRAAKIAKKADNPGLEAAAWNELGVLYRKQGDLESGLKSFQKALDLARIAKDELAMANAFNNMSVIYTMKEDYEKAIRFVKNSSAIKKKRKDELGLNYDYVNLGINFAELGKIDSALNYLKKSLRIRKKHNDLHALAIAYTNIGEVAAGDNRFDEARTYLDTALSMSRSVNFKDLTKHIYLTLSELYESQGINDSALLFYKQYSELKDSIFNKARSEQLLEIQTKYETAEKDRLIAEQELAAKQQNIWLGILAAGIFLLLLTLVYLSVYYRKKRQFLKKEADLKEELARKEMQNRIKNERLRISRDLHDNIGAELTLITSALDSKAFESKDEREKEWLNDVSNYAREAMSDLRETIWAFKADQMPVRELVAKVREFSGKISSMTGIEIIINDRVEEEVHLSPAQVINLYRISQEALQNAVKYANCRKINWEIWKEADALRISISDNGLGFDLKRIRKGYGLTHMQERMEELNGHCKIVSKPGEGTRIIATLPIAISTS